MYELIPDEMKRLDRWVCGISKRVPRIYVD